MLFEIVQGFKALSSCLGDCPSKWYNDSSLPPLNQLIPTVQKHYHLLYSFTKQIFVFSKIFHSLVIYMVLLRLILYAIKCFLGFLNLRAFKNFSTHHSIKQILGLMPKSMLISLYIWWNLPSRNCHSFPTLSTTCS